VTSGHDPDETPDAWRAAALAILGGGIALGLLSGHKRLGKAVPLVTAGVALGCAIPVALASRRPPIAPSEAAAALGELPSRPAFSIVARSAFRCLSRSIFIAQTLFGLP